MCIHLIDDLKKGNIAIFLIFTAKGRETQRVISASLTTSLKIYVFSFFPLLTLLDCSSKINEDTYFSIARQSAKKLALIARGSPLVIYSNEIL